MTTSKHDLVTVLEREVSDAGARARIAAAIGLTASVRTRAAVRAALLLMGHGRTRAEIQQVLRERFCISRATAYRILGRALDERVKPIR